MGAGFSAHAGLPLTATFTERMLNTVGLSPDGASVLQVSALKKFVHDAFDHSISAHADFWPRLEDIFTCIDLAANTGHHLGSGQHYSPSELRTLRRALIVRAIGMLRQAYVSGSKRAGQNWKRLELFFSLLNPDASAFLSMNWDTVIEEGIAKTISDVSFDYGCDAIAARIEANSVHTRTVKSSRILKVIKPHGSVNWLYCDACRSIFWFPPDKTERIASELFRKRDWDVAAQISGRSHKKKIFPVRFCPTCQSNALGTRLATFSYRKALEFPMHQKSWFAAEHLLRQADTWIFVGYSLPAADFEFKYLLKHVQLSNTTKPRIIVITGGGKIAAHQAYQEYQRFFGREISRSKPGRFFSKGLDDSAIAALQDVGALNRPRVKLKKLVKSA